LVVLVVVVVVGWGWSQVGDASGGRTGGAARGRVGSRCGRCRWVECPGCRLRSDCARWLSIRFRESAGARMGSSALDGSVSRRDLEALGWVCEQYAARIDQVAARLGCKVRVAQRLAVRLREARLVEVRRVLVGEPAWVVPTVKGLRACGLSFGLWRPRLGALAHVAAVTDVRLHIQASAPEAGWVGERVLAREKQGAREHLADGVVVLDERRIAIEVELTVKSKRRTRAIIEELTGRYDAVLYFCAPGPRRLIRELAAGGEWPSLGIRELPGRGGDLA
jgi:hypothetical protein